MNSTTLPTASESAGLNPSGRPPTSNPLDQPLHPDQAQDHPVDPLASGPISEDSTARQPSRDPEDGMDANDDQYFDLDDMGLDEDEDINIPLSAHGTGARKVREFRGEKWGLSSDLNKGEHSGTNKRVAVSVDALLQQQIRDLRSEVAWLKEQHKESILKVVINLRSFES